MPNLNLNFKTVLLAVGALILVSLVVDPGGAGALISGLILAAMAVGVLMMSSSTLTSIAG